MVWWGIPSLVHGRFEIQGFGRSRRFGRSPAVRSTASASAKLRQSVTKSPRLRPAAAGCVQKMGEEVEGGFWFLLFDPDRVWQRHAIFCKR